MISVKKMSLCGTIHGNLDGINPFVPALGFAPKQELKAVVISRYLSSDTSQVVIMSHDAVDTRRLVLKHAMLMLKVVDSARKQVAWKHLNLYSRASPTVTIQLINGCVNVCLIVCLVVFDVKVPSSLIQANGG